jgi:hypothetical protein
MTELNDSLVSELTENTTRDASHAAASMEATASLSTA